MVNLQMYNNTVEKEHIKTLHGVSLYVTKQDIIFVRDDLKTEDGDVKFRDMFSIQWGHYRQFATGIREIGTFYSDDSLISAINMFFEMCWTATNMWLNQYTTDGVIAESNPKRAVRMKSEHEFFDEFDEDEMIDVVEDIFEYLKNHTEAQDLALESRRERVDEPIYGRIERLDPADYVGEYTAKDVLFTEKNRRDYIDEMNERIDEEGWENINPNQRVEREFNKIDEIQSEIPKVVTNVNGRPQCKGVDGVYELSDEDNESGSGSENVTLFKAIEVACYQNHVELVVDDNYDSGDLTVKIEEIHSE